MRVEAVVLHLSIAVSLILLTGCGGDPAGPEGQIRASVVGASPLEVYTGQSATVTVNVQRMGGYDGAVSLSAHDLPTGITATFAPASLAANVSSSTLTLVASPGATGGTGTMKIRASGASVDSHETSLEVQIIRREIALAVAPLTVDQGGSGTSTIQIARTNFTENVELAVTGMPSGITARIASPATTGNNADLIIDASASATVGTHPLTVSAAGSGIMTATATLSLTIRPRAIALMLESPIVEIAQGHSSVMTVTIVRTNFTGGVAVDIAGLPAGVTAEFSPSSTVGNSSTLTLSVGTSVPEGSHTLTITGNGGGLSSEPVELTLVILRREFSLRLDPQPLVVRRDASASTTLEVQRTNFPGDVTLSVSGAPSGVTVDVSPSPAAGDAATVSVSATAVAPLGTHTLTITGELQGVQRQAMLTLEIEEKPRIQIEAAPENLEMNIGSSASSEIAVSRTNFLGTVSLAVSGAPNGVSAVVTPSVSAGAATLTVEATLAAVPGTFPLTVTGRGTGIDDATIQVQVTIRKPSVKLAANPEELTLAPGATGNSDITIDRTNYGASVSLAVTGAPTGVTASIAPTATSNSAATLTVRVGGTTAPGNFTLTIHAEGEGVASATADVAVQVLATPALVTVTATDPIASEEQLEPAIFTISRSGPVTEGLPVNFVLTGTATNGVDFVTVPPSIEIPAGQPSVEVRITPIDDDLDEPTETVILTVGQGDYAIGTQASAQITVGNRPKVLPLANGRNHAGTIAFAGELDAWTLHADAGDLISISIAEVEATTSDFWPWIRLRDPSGIIIAQNAYARTTELTLNAPAAGTYTVIVGSWNGVSTDGTGSYELQLARIPGAFEVAEEGGPLTNGANHTGRIHLGDMDLWTFEANVGDFVDLSIADLDPQGSGHFATYIRVVSPSGELVHQNSGRPTTHVAFTVDQPGIWTVIVRSWDGVYLDGIGSYELQLVKIPGTFTTSSGDEGGELTAGTSQSGVIHLGDRDPWTFAATAGASIIVSVSKAGQSTLSPWIRLVSPSGAVVGEQAGANSAQISITAPVTGVYTVIVGSWDGVNLTGTGSYVLQRAP